MHELLKLIFVLTVAAGSYSSAIIVNGRRVCDKCRRHHETASPRDIHLVQ